MLQACSPIDDRCDEPPVPAEVAGSTRDSALGTFEGTLSWLQTGEETGLKVLLRANETEGVTECEQSSVPVQVDVATEDEVLVRTFRNERALDDDGFLVGTQFSFGFGPAIIVGAGKVPEAPGLLERSPTALLTVAWTGEGTYDVTLTIHSSSDKLHVALGSVQKTGP